jgi:hypothetical protein
MYGAPRGTGWRLVLTGGHEAIVETCSVYFVVDDQRTSASSLIAM